MCDSLYQLISSYKSSDNMLILLLVQYFKALKAKVVQYQSMIIGSDIIFKVLKLQSSFKYNEESPSNVLVYISIIFIII